MSFRYPAGLITANSPVNANYPSGVWTPQQAYPYIANNVWGDDPYFNQTVLLLHGDGTNGAQNNTFLDSSTNNFTITRNGDTTQGTFSPFSVGAGEWSNWFNGSTGYLELANATALQIGGGAFTIEAWIYPTNSGSYRTIISKRSGGTAEWELTLNNVDNKLAFYTSTSYITSNQVNLNAWNHIAASYNGTTLELYINGTRGFSGAMTVTNSTNVTRIGAVSPSGADFQYFPGYISNVRVIKGTALYTGTTLSVPTAPFTNITNTSLLTCQSNRFVDNGTANSGTGFAITRNGDVRVTPFSPFAPSAAYDPAVNGGSGYFDGTGDYLTVPDNNAFAFGSGDFSVECFFYNTGTNGFLVQQGQAGSTTNTSFVLFITGGDINAAVYHGSTPVGIADPNPCPLNQWVHVALVRTSATTALFVNGTRVGTKNISTNSLNNSTAVVVIGARETAADPLTGYISNVRIIKGSHPYDATSTTLTVPTSPLTAIANTSLLSNFTNAGILDNTNKNVLETEGNAQIDTSIVKYGTGSMEFDGTGDYLTLPNNIPNFYLSVGDWTVEAWVYKKTTGRQIIISQTQNNASPYAGWLFMVNTTNVLRFEGTNSAAINSPNTFPLNQWIHVAAVRSSGTITLYENGVSVASGSVSITDYNNVVTIGQFTFPVSGSEWNGYIDDLRITKGIARYTANFIPPIARMPNQ